MTDSLARCPCGATPGRLLQRDGDTVRWQYVGGDCCGEWEIGASRPDMREPLDGEGNTAAAVEA